MPDAVAVIGSINVDHTITVGRFPRPGETLLGLGVTTSMGGKGANQAIAASRAGARVCMIGAVGDDGAGRDAVANLRQAGVDTQRIIRSTIAPTGTAWITVASGENTIIVAPGANDALGPSDPPRRADVVLCQLEVPLAVVEHAGAHCTSLFILNAAPARALPDTLLRCCDVLIVNEHELAEVAGVPAPDPADVQAVATACQRLLGRGAKVVVVTLGPLGALLCTAAERVTVAAPAVDQVVDTVGAGDAFCGVFAARAAAGDSLTEAVRWGVAAGSFSVRKAAAQASYPNATELAAALRSVPPPHPRNSS